MDPSLSQRLRQAHALIAPFVLLPLALTVTTGVGYRVLRNWAGLGRDQAHILMVLHEGEWGGPGLDVDHRSLAGRPAPAPPAQSGAKRG